MEAVGQIVRNLVVFLMCLVGLLAFVLLNVLMIPTNYLATSFAFYLLGYDGMPAESDLLIGPYMGGFFQGASVTQFFAMVLTLACFFGLFVAFHSLFHIFKLLDDRKAYLLQSDPESAAIASRMLLREAFLLFVLWVPPLVWILHWDMELFRLRSIAGALAIEDPAVASQLLNWEEQMKENSLQWAWPMTQMGAWGYLAMTAVACLGIEYSMGKTSNAWARILSSIQGLFGEGAAKAQEVDFYGYDLDGQPVYDPNSPIAYDVYGQPLAHEEASPVPPDTKIQPPFAEEFADTSQGLPIGAVQGANGYHQEPQSSNLSQPYLWDPAEPEATPSERAAAGHDRGAPAGSEALHEVIGGPTGQKVILQQALADKTRYWVDPERLQVWDAGYREALFGENFKKAA